MRTMLATLILVCRIAAVFGKRDNTNIFDWNTDSDATLQVIQNVRESIVNLTDVFWKANRTNLSAKFLRLAFHDAVGGMDGCVDLSQVDNFGLDIPIDALKPIVKRYAKPESHLSRADIWALAGLTGIEISQPIAKAIKFPLQFIGRIDCDDSNVGQICRDENLEQVECSYDRGPYRHFPSPHLNTDALLDFFYSTFGFSARQTVVIMGAHTIGFSKREHSGIHGPVGWVRDPHVFDNGYYRMLVGAGNCVGEYVDDAPNWSQTTMDNRDLVLDNNVTIPNQFVWVRPSGNSAETSDQQKSLIMTSSDMALVVRTINNVLLNPNPNPNSELCNCIVSCISWKRDFTVTEPTNKVKCRFKNFDSCPFAKSTGLIMVDYRRDNEAFIRDFRDTFNLMIAHGYNTTCPGPSVDCINHLQQVDFSITQLPTTTVPSSVPSAMPSSKQLPTELTRAPAGHMNHSTDISKTPSSITSSGYLLGLAAPYMYCVFVLNLLLWT